MNRSGLNHGPSTIPSHMVANPVRGLVDRKIPEHHLQSSNERIKIKTRQKKKQWEERKTNTPTPKRIGRTQRREGDPKVKHMHDAYTHARNTKRDTISPAASHPIPPRIATTVHLHPKAYHLQHRTLRILTFSSRRRRCCFGSP